MRQVLERLDALVLIGQIQNQQGEHIMAGIDDFNQSLTDLSNSISKIAADIAAALVILQAPNTSDAAFEAAAQTVEAGVAQLNTLAGQVEAVVPPTPVPPPAQAKR